MRTIVTGLALLLAAACSMPDGREPAACWVPAPEASRLGFSVRQEGRRIEGRFASYGARICFAPGAPEESRFEVTVDTGSVETGNARRDQALRSEDFLHVGAYPQARYVARRFTRLEGGWQARGELTLRGRTRAQPVRFEFRQLPDGGAELVGEAQLDRTRYGVGPPGGETIGREVRVAFHLRLAPAGG